MPSACSSERKPIRSCRAAAQPIDRPGHDDIELAPAGVLVHGVKAGALVAALRAANALVTVHRDDLMPRACRRSLLRIAESRATG